MKPRLIGLTSGTLLLLLAATCGCSKATEPPAEVVISGRTMGTGFTVKVVPSSGQPVNTSSLRREIASLLNRVNRQMSTYLDDSEITLFNHYGGTDWFDISPEFAEVLDQALRIARMTDGAFDVTVAPIVDLWGFGRSRSERVPPPEEIETILASTGYRKLTVRRSPPAVKKAVPSLRCDLSGIAKGFAVDRIGIYLEQMGIEDYMVEIGGEVRCRGSNSERVPWRIGIESPNHAGSFPQVVGLSGFSLATSGDYNNYFEIEGVRYSHTIDPLTGSPVNHALASVSVVHTTCMEADALATAIVVMGPKKGLEFAATHGLAVFAVERNGSDLRETKTPQMGRFLIPVTGESEDRTSGERDELH